MTARPDNFSKMFRRVWWFALTFVVLTGLWQGYGAWLWERLSDHA
jgi:hypothetical protein